jgi:hypothetical protein
MLHGKDLGQPFDRRRVSGGEIHPLRDQANLRGIGTLRWALAHDCRL